MLIQDAINLLGADLTALAWVELYGGVVQRVTIATEDSQQNITYKRFPVSCSFTGTDCNQNQRYMQLTPDSSKKSVLYWEVRQGFRDVGNVGQFRKKRKLVGVARLVGWLNTNKLGINECNTAAKAARSVIPLVYSRFEALTGVFQNSNIEFQLLSEEVKDDAIFSNYDYGNAGNKNGFLLHPYDYFALNVQVTLDLSLCDYELAIDTPITCTDFSKIP